MIYWQRNLPQNLKLLIYFRNFSPVPPKENTNLTKWAANRIWKFRKSISIQYCGCYSQSSLWKWSNYCLIQSDSELWKGYPWKPCSFGQRIRLVMGDTRVQNFYVHMNIGGRPFYVLQIRRFASELLTHIWSELWNEFWVFCRVRMCFLARKTTLKTVKTKQLLYIRNNLACLIL